MQGRKAIYIYPYTGETYKEGGNSYIRNLVTHLRNEYHIVNKKTAIGMLDVLINMNKSDIIYFNWIEDLPDRRFGYLQVLMLFLILVIAKLTNKKIIWFIHNNISHTKKNLVLKKAIIRLMKRYADLILSHSTEVKLDIPKHKLHVFHHPIEDNAVPASKKSFSYDLLIWGSVSPYKGVSGFVDFVATSATFKNYSILIAGRFTVDSYYEYVKERKPENITIINKTLPEEELSEIFSLCPYVLFTYNSPSVLSSASLCKSLSFRKTVIAPRTGSFKELGDMGLLYNYDSFEELETLLEKLRTGKLKPIDDAMLLNYIQRTGWDDFTKFLNKTIETTLYRRPARQLSQA